MQKKILVIEDDSDVVEIVTVVLENAGYDVIFSPTTKPISEVIDIKPDLILLDHWLPEDPGTDFCLLLKSNQLTKRIPVILFSAQRTIAKNAQECGADAYLAKPFDIDDLEAIIQKMI